MIRRLYILAAALAFLASCAGVERKEPAAVSPGVEKLSPEVQNELAFKAFEEILEMTANVPRPEIIDKLEEKYMEVTRNYPDSFLAQESYLHMIKLNSEDYKPPRVDRVRALYSEFRAKYPESKMAPAVDFFVAKLFYAEGLWDDVLAISRPAVNNYIKTGKLDSPYFLFLYSEAKYHKGDMAEAEKGYRTVVELFPSTTEAKISGKRIDDMKAGKK